jgi:hypothetical protein
MAVLTSIGLQDFCLVVGSPTSNFSRFKLVITGFNTDIEHDGVVYHVQTEDKGLDSPLILSLVYSGGAILASKRTRYEDLIAEGFNEEVLVQRLQRQHRLICAAINAGRLEDLKRMGAKAREEAETLEPLITKAPETATFNEIILAQAPEAETRALPHAPEIAASPIINNPGITIASLAGEDTLEEIIATQKRGPSSTKDAKGSAYTVYDSRRRSLPDQVMGAESGLALTILNDHEFVAGATYTISVLLEDRSGGKEKSLHGVGVSVKILGTAFRPQIYSVKTEADGVAAVSATMPSFTSGRAAVLVRAVVKGQLIEVRRVIHPAE